MNIPNQGAIKVEKAAVIAAAQIRNAIIRGDLKHGENLPAEANFITAYNVSRPTFREALRILESEGLITVMRGARGGARVSAPTYDIVARAAGIALQSQNATIGDLYEMRTIIEPSAARMVAIKNGKRAAAVLSNHLDKEFSLVEDRAAVSLAIADFHRIMIEQCGNITLTLISHALQGLVERHLKLAHLREPSKDLAALTRRTRFGLRSHAKLIAFFENEDADGAEAHWRNHMNVAGTYWLSEVAPTTVVELLE